MTGDRLACGQELGVGGRFTECQCCHRLSLFYGKSVVLPQRHTCCGTGQYVRGHFSEGGDKGLGGGAEQLGYQKPNNYMLTVALY